MTFQGDPHRTLGIPPGASLNEIRSAYRRLVKKYHPDAAGERALPRFLAIQAAYEQLVDADGRLRPSGPAPAKRSRAEGGRGPGASRDAWRARRAAGTSSGARSAGTSPDPRRRRGDPGTGPDGGTRTRRPAGAGEERPHRRGPRKATPGSTTYDEAAETPLDPRWDGSAWYGPTSGTYWTLNPREYADPRKHGPEYEARARRAMEAEARAMGADVPPAASGAPGAAAVPEDGDRPVEPAP